jgi:hypothetical protein
MPGNSKGLEALTQVQRIANARKAGLASAESRSKKTLLKDIILEFYECRAPYKMRERLKRMFPGMSKVIDDITIQQALVLSMVNQAAKGNIRAFDSLRDTAGQKPVDKVAQTDPTGEEGLTITFVNGGVRVKDKSDDNDQIDSNTGK